VKWLRDNMGIIKSAKEVGDLAATVESTGGVYFVPAFSGLFAPHWRDDARGTIVGMTQYTTKAHLCRATLEAVSYATKDIIDAMTQDSGHPITLLRVDGGLRYSYHRYDQERSADADSGGH
jgi:glycerol kinase